MPRPCSSTPIKQTVTVYARSPGRENREPHTPGHDDILTPRSLPSVDEEIVVMTPRLGPVISLGSEYPGVASEYPCSNGGRMEGSGPEHNVQIHATDVASVNGYGGTRGTDGNGIVGFIDEQLASVQDEFNQHHHAMVDCFHRHRQAISNMVWTSLNGHPADLSVNTVVSGATSYGMNGDRPVIPNSHIVDTPVSANSQPIGKSIPNLKHILPHTPRKRGLKPVLGFKGDFTSNGSITAKQCEIDTIAEDSITIAPVASILSSKHQLSEESRGTVRRRQSAQSEFSQDPEKIRKSLDNLGVQKLAAAEKKNTDRSSSGSRGSVTRKSNRSNRLDIVFSGSSDSVTPILDLVIAFLIMLNALVLCLYSQWEGYKSAVKLGRIQADNGWPEADIIFTIFDHFFCVAFLMEFCIRIRYLGWAYWKDPWNDFDAFLVATSLVELYVMRPFAARSGSGTNLTLLRLARIFKLVKVLRAVRVLKVFSSLRILTKTMAASFSSLAWSMILLGIIVCLAGIFLTQTLVETINDEDIPKELRSWVFTNYGTSVRGMYTMFEVTMSGCWPNYARRLIYEISPMYGAFWVLYVSVVVFAVIRIITAIFLKHTMDNAGSDADLMIAAQMKKKRIYVDKLAEAFRAIDESGDGTITRQEFHEIITHPKVKAYLAVLDLEVHETTSLFDLLEDNDDGVITYQEFLDGVMRLKGQARTLDIVEIQCNIKRLLSCVYAVCDALCLPNKIFVATSEMSASMTSDSD